MKEEDTFHRGKKKPEWSGDKQSTCCEVQNTDNKDVQWTWEKNRWTSENLHKEIETMKTIITEIKATLERINGKLDETENQYVGRQGSRKHSIGTAKI